MNNTIQLPLRFSIFTLLLLFTLLFLQACESDEDQPLSGFTGTVTSSGVPVADASVGLSGDNGQYSTRAGSDGRFQIDGVAAGEYLLTVREDRDNGTFIQYQKEVSLKGSHETGYRAPRRRNVT